MNNKNQNHMAVNSAEAVENPLLNEPLTFGIVLRGLPEEIQELKDFLEQSSLTVIYKHISYGKLFITQEDLNAKD